MYSEHCRWASWPIQPLAVFVVVNKLDALSGNAVNIPTSTADLTSTQCTHWYCIKHQMPWGNLKPSGTLRLWLQWEINVCYTFTIITTCSLFWLCAIFFIYSIVLLLLWLLNHSLKICIIDEINSSLSIHLKGLKHKHEIIRCTHTMSNSSMSIKKRKQKIM